MVKKAKPKAPAKAAVPQKARRPTVAAARPAPQPKDESKYDQTGAPWWKKFRPSTANM